MKAILDTHTFLWWNMGDSQLSQLAREFITDGRNDLFLSAATAWEIAIKCAKGRLILPELPAQYVSDRMTAHPTGPTRPAGPGSRVRRDVNLGHLDEYVHRDLLFASRV